MPNRRLLFALATLAVLLVAGAVAFQIAARRLHTGIEQALGPRASVGAISIGLTGITLHDLRVRAAAKGWPVDDELRAARVRVVPDLTSLFRSGWRVSSVSIDDPYVSVLRTRDGKLHVVPALLERERAPSDGAKQSAAPSVRIGEVRLSGAAVEFFDASVRTPAHRMRIEQLHAELGPLQLPALDEPVHIDLQGVFKGPQRNGRIAIAGQFTPATRDAQLDARLSGVDLIALQPYLLRVNEGGVRRGTLDLTLDAAVAKNRLRAPGSLTLIGLELGAGGGPLATFAGVPRQAVIAAMSRNGRIELKFVLEGRLDDPKFSLNEAFAMRAAVGLAESLGVSLGGMVEGVGSVIKGLLGR